MTDIASRVNAGVKWLDRAHPGWWQKIHPRELNIEDERRCVLGQLFGRFQRGVRKLNLSPAMCEDLGFATYSDPSDPIPYAKLTTMWIKEFSR